MTALATAILAGTVLVAVPGVGPPLPAYEELDEMPGIVRPPTRSIGEGRTGMEWSSVISFDGDLLLLDDRKGPVVPAAGSTPHLAPESQEARDLVLFRMKGESLERAWAAPFRRDIVEPGHPFLNLEAMAALGPHLYLMASHAPRRDGSYRAERQVVLRLTTGRERRVDWRATRLREAIPDVLDQLPELAASVSDADVDPSEREARISIEGMVRLQGTEDFLLGLRNPKATVPGHADPRCEKAAIVLRVKGLADLFDGGDARPRLSVHALLCMGDRGIAAMAWDPDSASYLIAASRPPGGSGETILWQWDPRPCADPALHERMRFTHLRLEGIDRVASGPWQGKLALAFDSHYYAGARRPENVNEGSLVIVDRRLPSLCP